MEKKVDFNGSKIALAIKKGFDSIIDTEDESGEQLKYTTKDINKEISRIFKNYSK